MTNLQPAANEINWAVFVIDTSVNLCFLDCDGAFLSRARSCVQGANSLNAVPVSLTSQNGQEVSAGRGRVQMSARSSRQVSAGQQQLMSVYYAKAWRGRGGGVSRQKEQRGKQTEPKKKKAHNAPFTFHFPLRALRQTRTH